MKFVCRIRIARIAAYASAVMLICLAIIAVMPVHGEAEIYNDVIRLHVLALSDSEYDQTVKLAVRDVVLKYVSEITLADKEIKSADEMHSVIEAELEGIRASAKRCADEYYDDVDVSVMLSRESYPVRNYNGLSLPAGVYDSLRVVIGGGEGHNWWCVLYPPLCIRMASAYSDPDDVEVLSGEYGLKREETLLIASDAKRYRIRFKLLEILSGIFGFDY